jgi:hypothetical protein
VNYWKWLVFLLVLVLHLGGIALSVFVGEWVSVAWFTVAGVCFSAILFPRRRRA